MSGTAYEPEVDGPRFSVPIQLDASVLGIESKQTQLVLKSFGSGKPAASNVTASVESSPLMHAEHVSRFEELKFIFGRRLKCS
jgi:hypothetical protein